MLETTSFVTIITTTHGLKNVGYILLKILLGGVHEQTSWRIQV